MQHLEVSRAVRRFFKSLGFKGLSMQSACALLSTVACLALPYFFHIIS